MRRLRLTGAPAAVEVAVDRLHVHADVHAVVELDGYCEVFVEGPLPDLAAVRIEELPIPDEPVTGREGDRPVDVGDGILVRPPWVPAPIGFAGIELVVPRGIAFGTGEHGSTQAALRVLRRMWTDEVDSVADVGTGSGILALLALQLGCPRILACDVDPDAVRTARELVPPAAVVLGGPDALPHACDAVVANMRGGEIEGCIDGLLRSWNRRGPLVLSGLRAAEEAPIGRCVDATLAERVEVAGFIALGWRA